MFLLALGSANANTNERALFLRVRPIRSRPTPDRDVQIWVLPGSKPTHICTARQAAAVCKYFSFTTSTSTVLVQAKPQASTRTTTMQQQQPSFTQVFSFFSTYKNLAGPKKLAGLLMLALTGTCGEHLNHRSGELADLLLPHTKDLQKNPALSPPSGPAVGISYGRTVPTTFYYKD